MKEVGHTFDVQVFHNGDDKTNYRISPSWVMDGIGTTPRQAFEEQKNVFAEQMTALETILATDLPERAELLLGDGAYGFKFDHVLLTEPNSDEVMQQQVNLLVENVFQPKEEGGEQEEDDDTIFYDACKPPKNEDGAKPPPVQETPTDSEAQS